MPTGFTMSKSSGASSSPPLVSVCIPTYRGATLLGATIESVLAQSLTDFELIIIDDNSPDNTAEIVGGFVDRRIRYLRNPKNLGPQRNWNRCLEEASGHYFKLLPQDDTLYPDTLARQVEVLEKDAENAVALVFGVRRIIDAAGKVLATRGYPGGREGRIDAETVVRRCVRRGTNLIGEPGSVLFRRSLASKVGQFDASIPYIVDLDYWVRLLEHGSAHYLATPVATFRVSPGSWSVAIGSSQSEEVRRFIARLDQNPRWHLGRLDVLSGGWMARINNLMRLVFYRLVLRK